ncbi:hypothetical protein THAR02_11012 [Trichoderma harzianum]|uniref:Cytochrome P450 n=1 Tax=Trichoderma harzianum TaxID=5544 RepID=A0A0F9Z8G9_TRIHA|nr:hypothetical protein THAR02_11012 [Trichoderma harzianum]
MDEVRRLPEDQLSLRKEIFNNMHGRYTELGAEHALGVSAIKNDLTNNIGRMLPELQDEAIFALDEHIGPAPEWTQLYLYQKLLHISALTNGRFFVGLPMSRNPAWITACLKYTSDLISVVMAVGITKFFIGPLVHLVAPFLPQIRSFRRDKAIGSKVLRPAIDALLLSRQKPDAVENPANNQYNLISWILNQMDTTGAVDFDTIALEQLFAGFASIHNTAVTVINILFDLASHPQYIPAIRAEIEEVLREEPNQVIRKINLPKLRKLDSLLRESQRMNPASLTSLQRLVVAKDGIKLSTGHTIPRGTSIGFMHPFAPWVKTPSNLESHLALVQGQPPLEDFYPFRHSEMRAVPGHENGHQFVQTGPDNINFGHGPMACPGRFFAGAEVKCIIIEILRRYDVALGPGGEGAGGPSGLKRPTNVTYPNLFLLPDFKTPLYFKELPQVVPVMRS